MKLLLTLFLGWCAAALCANAQDADLSVLQNLPTVGIAVRGLSPDGAKLGLKESALIATVREAIEPTGVQVLLPPLLDRRPEVPVLEIAANVTQTGKVGYFFILDLQLRESLKPVRAHRTLVTIPAVTWAQQTGGATAKAENVHGALARLAQRFAGEWEQAQGR